MSMHYGYPPCPHCQPQPWGAYPIPVPSSPTPNTPEDPLAAVIRNKRYWEEIEKLFKGDHKKDGDQNKREGLSKHQVFTLMMVSTPIIWLFSTGFFLLALRAAKTL